MRLTLITATILALTLLAGCGRSGAPLKPSEAIAKKAKDNKQPILETRKPNSKNDEKRFILDSLLD